MFHLQKPRHISTLPWAAVLSYGRHGRTTPTTGPDGALALHGSRASLLTAQRHRKWGDRRLGHVAGAEDHSLPPPTRPGSQPDITAIVTATRLVAISLRL